MPFFKTFFITCTLLFLGHSLLIEYVNPQGTAILSSQKFFKNQVNIEYAKFKALEENKHYENLIVGSSTSEAYQPTDVSNVFKGESYSLSLGGATTDARYLMIKKALRTNPNIKRVFLIADFYEFNKDQTKPSILYNKEMSALIQEKAKPLGYIKHYFNHRLLEDSLRVLKRKKKNKSIVINKDGSTNRSMILSPIEGDKLEKKISKKDYDKLNKQIIENFTTYSRDVLNNFNLLSEKTKKYYKEILKLTSKNNIELNIILSPYHIDFKKRLLSNNILKERYLEWKQFIIGLKTKHTKIKVLDGTTHSFANDQNSSVWRDGLHYNRYAAFKLISSLKI